MNIPNYLWRFLSLLFIGLAVVGVYISYKQTFTYSIDSFASQLDHSKSNLQKNYIINVKVVEDPRQCNDTESAASSPINFKNKQYNLQYLTIENENNQRQIIQLCQEIHYNYNFATQYQSFKESQNKENQSQKCKYNGIELSAQENTNLCPISDIIFSEAESIENYEKISINNNNKFKFFVRRNDLNSTPLVGIHFIKTDEQEFLQNQTNITFTMLEICKDKYAQYEGLCQFDSNPSSMKVSLALENQVPIQQECSFLELLNFEKSSVILYSTLLKYLNKFIGVLIIGLNVMIIAVVVFLNFESEVKDHVLNQYATYSLINLVYFYILYHDFSNIKSTVEANCYSSDIFLQNINDQSLKFCEELILFLYSQLALMISPLLFEIYKKSQEKEINQFMKIEQDHEMSTTL